MNKKEVYNLITTWENMNGESFFEYFGDNESCIHTVSLMFWLYGKGYIGIDKMNSFSEKFNKAEKTYQRPSASNCIVGYDIDYSLFPYGECDEDAKNKAILIVSEFISGNTIYEKRLTDFAYEGKGWASFDTDKDKIEYKEEIIKINNGWNKRDELDYEKAIELNIEDINKRLFNEYQEDLHE